MKVVILSAGQGWHNDELKRAFIERGHTCTLLPITGLVGRIGEKPYLTSKGIDLDGFDVALVRIIPRGSLDQIIFRMDALHLLAARGVRGVRVFNPPTAIERTVDKFYTSGLMAQAGLLTPRTVACERSDDALDAFAALGRDVMVKPLFGSMGLGIVRVQDEDVAYRVFKALELERAVYYLQETIPHPGRDVRAFVLGGRVLAAIERVADDGGWRTNIARGAQARPVCLTPDQEGLCLRAAEVVGAEYAGVDLLPTTSGLEYVLEVNGVPGWQGLQSTTDLDIAGEIVKYLERSTNPREFARMN
jgi:RimK family alpha-L-glutamate ligase